MSVIKRELKKCKEEKFGEIVYFKIRENYVFYICSKIFRKKCNLF